MQKRRSQILFGNIDQTLLLSKILVKRWCRSMSEQWCSGCHQLQKYITTILAVITIKRCFFCSFIIGPESDHCLPLSVSNWLTDSCLVNLIDVTLACEDSNSKLVDVVTVAEEDRVGNNFCRFRSPGKMWSWSLASFFLLMFCRGYEVESLSIFWS